LPNRMSALDIERLRQIFGDGLVGARDVLELTITDATALGDQIRAAIVTSACESAVDPAHALKGICLTVGAMELAGIAETLEDAVKRGDREAGSKILIGMNRALDALRTASTGLP